MLQLVCVTVSLVFLSVLFTLWLLVEQQPVHSDSTNITIWPTLPSDPTVYQTLPTRKSDPTLSTRKFDPLPLNSLRTFLRFKREGKPSRKERMKMAKFSITTTTKRRTAQMKGHLMPKKGKNPRRAYTLDINSEDYSAKKFANLSVNPAQYAYELRMSASEYVKSIMVKDIRKQFFNINVHRKKLSQLEILKNQSRVLYDNYLKIINQSTTINWWRKLRDARYNNTSPNIDIWATLEEVYQDMNVYGGTTSRTEDPFTVHPDRVKQYKAAIDDMLGRIPKGPVIYDSKDILGSSGIV
ncbi:hypothetical protein WDU94_001129 [Cyamophila willieti]